MQDKHEKSRFTALSAICQELFPFSFDVLFQLAHRVLERRARVVNLVHNQYVLAHQAGHFQRGQVEPLRPGDFRAWRFNRVIRVSFG